MNFRYAALVTSIGLATGFSASVIPAFAAPPEPIGATLQWPCPNNISITLNVTGKQGIIDLPGGVQIVTSPGMRVTATAPNGNSVSYVITGVSRYETLPGTSNVFVTSTGRNLILVPEANGHPAGLFLTAGNVKFIVTSTGEEVTLFSGPGKVVDVCKVLA